MSRSGQTPRNGLAKVLWDAEPDDDPRDIASQKQEFSCPECGWQSDLRHNECMVCDYDHQLRRLESDR